MSRVNWSSALTPPSRSAVRKTVRQLPVQRNVAAGLPAGENPVYLATVALFVGLFGVGYLWSGATGRGEPIFIGIAAAGKISFVALLVGFWLAGALPARAPVAASPDLAFGVLFLRWLRSAI